jgi:hypothetical protein
MTIEALTTANINFSALLKALSLDGAVAVKMLKDSFRQRLLNDARGYTYEPLPEVVGSGENFVRQQMGRFIDFPTDSSFLSLKDFFQAWLIDQINNIEGDPFEVPVDFNALELARYEAGSLGITPHRDGFKYKNLVCIFMLGGRGRFYVCSDRAGNNAREIDASPGNVILMKAPGFLGKKERPFHFVTGIQETRYIFGLRQVVLSR